MSVVTPVILLLLNLKIHKLLTIKHFCEQVII